jgi:hypothetical protein
LWQLLRTLTQPTSEKEASIDCLAGALQRATRGLPTGSLIFVIADLNRDVQDLERVLGNLVQRNTVVLLPVDDPADWEIPTMGPMTFTGSDGALIEIDTDDIAARRAYQAAWQRRREILTTIAHGLGIVLMPIRTDREIHLSLIHSLEQRARSRAI